MSLSRLLAVLCLFLTLAAGSPLWGAMPGDLTLEKVWTTTEGLSHNSILSIAAVKDLVFLGTDRNLTVLKNDGTTTVWGPQNSPLKLQRVPAMIQRGPHLWTTCRSPVANGGTYRWDGLQWEVFEEIKDDMQSNNISCFHVDDQNMLWLGTADQGVNYYVHETNPYRKFGYLASKKGLLDNRVTCMTSRPGELWIGTLSGISIYRGRDGEKYLFTNYTRQEGLPAEHILSLAALPDQVFVGTTGGLTVFTNGSWRLLGKADGLADLWVSVLVVDGQELWIGTKQGLQRLRQGRIEPPITFREGLPSSHIQCLGIGKGADGATRIYVGTDRGLAVLRRQ